MREIKMENKNNIFITCPNHGPIPQEKFQTWDPNRFLNNFVKMEFEEKGTQRKEHLWIKINSLKEDGILEGVVDNDCLFDLGVDFGSVVEVPINKIEAFLGRD